MRENEGRVILVSGLVSTLSKRGRVWVAALLLWQPESGKLVAGLFTFANNRPSLFMVLGKLGPQLSGARLSRAFSPGSN